MKKIFNGTYTTLLMLLLLLLMASCLVIVPAQQNRPYKVSEEQVRDLLQRLEERADGFRSIVDIVLEVSRLDGTRREDRLDVLVEEFERAVDTLEERFNKHVSTTADVERVLRAAESVDIPVTRALAEESLHPDPSLRERAKTEWALVKSSLANLADFYNIQWKWASAAARGVGEENPRPETTPQELTIRGRLRRTVEPGGWLIDAGARQYLVINADRFKDAKWFRAGAEVSATGKVRRDVVTSYMQGTPFEARSVQRGGRRNKKE
jgi:hypothetical protein